MIVNSKFNPGKAWKTKDKWRLTALLGLLLKLPGWSISYGHSLCNLKWCLVCGETSLPCPPLLRSSLLWLFSHAHRGETGFEMRRPAAPPHPPPVPAISETPAIGGNLCQLLGNGLASKKHHQYIAEQQIPTTIQWVSESWLLQFHAPVRQMGRQINKLNGWPRWTMKG